MPVLDVDGAFAINLKWQTNSQFMILMKVVSIVIELILVCVIAQWLGVFITAAASTGGSFTQAYNLLLIALPGPTDSLINLLKYILYSGGVVYINLK